jgi:hypothetical protein
MHSNVPFAVFGGITGHSGVFVIIGFIRIFAILTGYSLVTLNQAQQILFFVIVPEHIA